MHRLIWIVKLCCLSPLYGLLALIVLWPQIDLFNMRNQWRSADIGPLKSWKHGCLSQRLSPRGWWLTHQLLDILLGFLLELANWRPSDALWRVVSIFLLNRICGVSTTRCKLIWEVAFEVTCVAFWIRDIFCPFNCFHRISKRVGMTERLFPFLEIFVRSLVLINWWIECKPTGEVRHNLINYC